MRNSRREVLSVPFSSLPSFPFQLCFTHICLPVFLFLYMTMGERGIEGKIRGGDVIRVVAKRTRNVSPPTLKSVSLLLQYKVEVSFLEETLLLVVKLNCKVKGRCPCAFPYLRSHSSRFFFISHPSLSLTRSVLLCIPSWFLSTRAK